MSAPPADGAPAIVWAVWLGATTARRLALSWGITEASAKDRLAGAVGRGEIVVREVEKVGHDLVRVHATSEH